MDFINLKMSMKDMVKRMGEKDKPDWGKYLQNLVRSSSPDQ